MQQSLSKLPEVSALLEPWRLDNIAKVMRKLTDLYLKENYIIKKINIKVTSPDFAIIRLEPVRLKLVMINS